MPSSNYELQVESSDPLAIVEIADASYRLLEQATGAIAKSLPPGLYVARAKYIDHVDERVVRHGETTTNVHFDATPYAVVRNFASSEEARLPEKIRTSRDSAPVDSWITIAVKRIASGVHGGMQGPTCAAVDFQVCDLFGRILHGFSKDDTDAPPGETDIDAADVASAKVDAGWYTLAMPSTGGLRILLPLYVSDRMSPTIFIEIRNVGDTTLIDLDRLIVSYDVNEWGIYADPARLQCISMARRSLELGRNLLAGPLMDILFELKFADPMLGLLGLQLLLLSREAPPGKDADMFVVVMSNLASILGSARHPDLVLAREHARSIGWVVPSMSGDDEPLEAPPLLRANWSFMSTDHARSKELLVKDSVLERVGQSLMRAGVWVVWKPPADESTLCSVPTVGTPVARRSRAPDAILADIVRMLGANEQLRDAIGNEMLADRKVGTVLVRTVAKTALHLIGEGSGEYKPIASGYSSRLAKSLALPLPLVTRSMSELRTWLEDRQHATEIKLEDIQTSEARFEMNHQDYETR